MNKILIKKTNKQLTPEEVAISEISKVIQITESINDKIIYLFENTQFLIYQMEKIDCINQQVIKINPEFWKKWQECIKKEEYKFIIDRMDIIKTLDMNQKETMMRLIHNYCKMFKVEKDFELIAYYANLKNLCLVSIYYGIREGALDRYKNIESIISFAIEFENKYIIRFREYMKNL